MPTPITVYFQVGIEIENPNVFHNDATDEERQAIRAESYAIISDSGMHMIMTQQPFTTDDDLDDFKAALQTKLTEQATPINTWGMMSEAVGQEHVYRNGQWICDTRFRLTKVNEDGNAVPFEQTFPEDNQMVNCEYFLTISSPHSWDGS